jgi:zinc/manganese transport system substrate-binding protein
MIAVLLAGCGSTASPGAGPGVLQVLAAENFWGSIAAQLGGSHVSVTSIVTNPNTDPHDYETNTADARAFAGSDYVIVNGAGYDDWAKRLLSGNPSSSRRVFTVADLLGRKQGDNPHFWYNPAWVEQVADRITSDYKAMDAAHAAYFDQQRTALRTAMQPYQEEIASMRSTYGGVKVGSTESIFVYLAQALGLNLVSPPAFMQAISESTDPPAQDVATFHQQIQDRVIRVLVYNQQTSGALTTRLQQLANQRGVPVVAIAETLQPTSATFQAWQLAQLRALASALSKPPPTA